MDLDERAGREAALTGGTMTRTLRWARVLGIGCAALAAASCGGTGDNSALLGGSSGGGANDGGGGAAGGAGSGGGAAGFAGSSGAGGGAGAAGASGGDLDGGGGSAGAAGGAGASGAGGAGGAAGVGGGAGAGGGGAGGAAGGAGNGGAAGAGGGGVCTPGATQPCYDGPPGTEGVGACLGGTQTCNAQGTGWSFCNGEVLPNAELCANGVDDNCDGTVDENPDNDGDGWGVCDGDCCDTPGGCSSTPSLVNPGAYEVVGNGVDDDCDATTSDATPPVDCGPAALQTPTSATDLANAMELCQLTTQNAPLPQKKWGVLSAELLAADGTSAKPKDIQVGVLANFGTNVSPKMNATMGALSSGTARDQGDPGWVQPNGGWTNGGNSAVPAVYLNAHGGQLQTKAGCATASDIHDSANLRLKIRVPTNAKSFSFKFKFYSAEYPEWVCTKFNDFFLALLQSSVAGIPADHNISFDANKNPVSVNNAFFQVCSGCPSGTGELAGTGTDGGTLWLTTTSPVTPGEDMQIEFIIWDTGDHSWDSLVLLDDWKWDLNPAQVGTKG